MPLVDGAPPTAGMELVRWDRTKPMDRYNLVLLTKKQLKAHQETASLDSLYSPELIAEINEKLRIYWDL